MADILLHDHTRAALEAFLERPSHALIIIGSVGAGKGTVAQRLIARLLNIPPEKINAHPYLSVIGPIGGKAIGIDEIRALQHFTSLKIPRPRGYTRFAVIEDAHRMTVEAQNALLKLIEEPPEATMLILTAPSRQALLPTIASRAQQLRVHPVAEELVLRHFQPQYGAEAIQKAYLVSGGLSGLLNALLSEDDAHPLVKASATARALLQESVYERLLQVDSLCKQPQEIQDVLFVLQQMAHVSLRRPAQPKIAQKWQRVLAGSYEAQDTLQQGGQTKLVLTNLLLSV